MTDEEAFLHMIFAEPDDVTPRLVFADWLEERGDARSEFIRLQCELEMLSADDPRRAVLAKREQELLQQYQVVWSRSFAEFLEGWEYHRGLVDTITVEARKLILHADALFHRLPLRHVRLTKTFDQHAISLARIPQLARLDKLDLSYNHIRDNGLAALARSPFLTGLITLELQKNHIADLGVEALADSTALGRLEVLQLMGNHLGDRAAAAFAASTKLPRLRILILGANGIADDGAYALAESRHLNGLTTLSVAGNPIGDRAKQALIDRFGWQTCHW